MSETSMRLIESNYIPEFSLDKDFDRYYKGVFKDFHVVKDYFPLLQITSLPTIKPKEIFVTGKLIPRSVFKKCTSMKDIERNSLYILGIYPSEFPQDNIYVEDFYKKINWSKIPKKHMHQRRHPKTNRMVLCTHHPEGEINALKQCDKTVAILSNAWKLYKQYKEYLKTKKWSMKDLRHGNDEAIAQLKKLKKYYGK